MTRATALGAGLVLVLLAALPGEGGAAPTALLLWHGLLVLLLLGLLLAPDRNGASRHVPAPVPLAALGVYLALAFAGAVRAPYGYAALIQLLELGAFTAVALVAARCGPTLPARLALPLLLAATAEGALALGQRLVDGQPRPPGTFLNPNHLAAWLALVILLNAPALLDDRNLRRKALVALALLPALAGFLLTGSRGALLGLAAGAGWLALASWRGMSRATRRVALAVALVAVIAGGWRVAERLHEADPYRWHRLRIWRASLGAVADAPWTGTGPRQFVAAARNLNFPDGEGPLRFDRGFSTTHSDLLRPFAELGLPGGLAMLAAVAACGIVLARRRRDGTPGPAHNGALAALVALGVQALVDNPSERPALYLLAAALLGSLLSRPAASSTPPAPASPRWRAALALALLGTFLAADVAPYLSWRALSGLPQRPLDASEMERLDRAIRLNPAHAEPWRRRARELAGDGTRWDANVYAAAREAAERAIRLQPAEARHRMTAAWVEALACRTLFPDTATRARAAARYREAEARSRHDPAIPIELARFLLDTGDPVGARRAAERALAIEPRAVPPRLLLADALLEQGGPWAAPRARKLIDEARELAGRWSHRTADGLYSARLLTLDAAAVARIERKLADAAATAPGA